MADGQGQTPGRVDDRLAVVLVGAGPRGAGLLERLVSNASVGERRPLEVHVVDPFPPGAGRVWRDAQSDLLRLNTTTEDLAVFTDASVSMAGPLTPGPTLFEWCQTHGPDLSDPSLADEAAALGPLDFPSRRLASAYLAFFHDRTQRRASAIVEVITHAQRAVDVIADVEGGRDLVVLENGDKLAADAVVLLNSHVDVRPAPPYATLAGFADDHGLTYVPPGYGGDLDLSMIKGGEDVIVRGLGLGFVDLMILLTEGRGGVFEPHAGPGDPGRLRYRRSGAEPHLMVGSRRGVPYHAKPMYRLVAEKPAATTFCTPAAVKALLERGSSIDFRTDLWPLIARELSWAYYTELGQGHPGRITVPWSDFAETFAAMAWGTEAYGRWIAEVVPDPADRFDPAALDRPLDGVSVADQGELSTWLHSYIRDDLARRQDVRFSADLGAFHAFLAVLPVIGPALASPLLDPRSLVADVYGWFMGFFSFYASGPPPDRLEQLLALEAAGVISFLGAGLAVDADPAQGVFVATSTTVPGRVEARCLLEATLPGFDLGRTEDPLLAALAARGEAVSQVLTAPDGTRVDTGSLRVDPGHHLVRADGSSSVRRFALGMHTTVKAAAFARPGSNGPVHRLNDQVARTLLAMPRVHSVPVTTSLEPPEHPNAALSGTGGR